MSKGLEVQPSRSKGYRHIENNKSKQCFKGVKEKINNLLLLYEYIMVIFVITLVAGPVSRHIRINQIKFRKGNTITFM